MINAAFNLIDEPWIKVRALTGEVREVSLSDLFDTAPNLRGLAGEVPTQDVAILRLLEAVILGAVRLDTPRHRDESQDLWAQWWRAGRFPEEVVKYLDRYRDRFYLVHGETPFLQVAGLHTASGSASGLVKLIADVPDGHQYFTTRAGAELESLSFAEAARWLVHCHAFDPAGIKTGAVGDSRVKGGKGYSMGYPAWAGNLGIVIAEGENLFQTLMFNWPVALVGDANDLPVWERQPLKACVAEDHPVPLGPADLMTWPSRRVLLHESEGRVVDVQISNGDRLGPQNQLVNESMAAWRKSAAQSKSAGTDVYMPVLHLPERRMWQGLAGLLMSAAGESQSAWVVKWLGELRCEELLPATQVIRLRAVGIEYGPQASSIAGMVDDSLRAQVIALSDPVLVAAAVDAAKRASDAVVALANLASNLEAACGGDSERPRSRTFELGYSLLDGPYRLWLADLADPSKVVETLDDWSQEVKRILAEAAYRLIDDAGPVAQIGREVAQRGSGEPRLLDAALAEIWFRAALNKALGLSPSSSQKQEANA
jgi:CRISPR system Cascade subunit CasA